MEDMRNGKYRPNTIPCLFEDSEGPFIPSRILIPSIIILMLQYPKRGFLYFGCIKKCILL